MESKLIQHFLTLLNQLRFYHWETTSFARHKGLGKAYDGINDLVDEFVEVCIGKYGREILQPCAIQLHSKNEVKIEDALNEMIQFLTQLNGTLNTENDSDLLNIRDSMLGAINQTKYLFTLK